MLDASGAARHVHSCRHLIWPCCHGLAQLPLPFVDPRFISEHCQAMQYQGLPLLPDLPALLRRGAAPDGLGKYDAELAQFKDSLLKDGGPRESAPGPFGPAITRADHVRADHSLDPAEVLTPLPPVPSGPSQLVVRRRSSIAVGAGLGSSSSSSSSRRPLRRPKHPSHEAERSTETIRQAIARAQVQQAGEDGLRISYDERRGVLSVGVPGRATFRARLQPDTESLASRTICTRVTQEQSMLHVSLS